MAAGTWLRRDIYGVFSTNRIRPQARGFFGEFVICPKGNVYEIVYEKRVKDYARTVRLVFFSLHQLFKLFFL